MAESERYTSITRRKGKQVYIPDNLLTVAGIQEGTIWRLQLGN